VPGLSTDGVLIRQLQGLLGGNRLIVGMVDSAAAVIVGTGFTASTSGTGVYTVTFDVPFGGNAVALVTPVAAAVNRIARVTTNPAPGSFGVATFTDAGVLAGSGFGFLAVGP
jgi:hypothetical protein